MRSLGPMAEAEAPPGIIADLLPLAFPVDRLDLLPGNPRIGDVDAVARSYAMFGQRKPVVARRQGQGGVVLAGNHQLLAARQLGWSHIAVVWTDDDDLTAKAFALADNRTSDLGRYDDSFLVAYLQDVEADAELLAAASFTPDDIAALLEDAEQAAAGLGREATNRLRDSFVVPPFSVLDARQGYWQDRKRLWLSLGIRSELGRGEVQFGITPAGSPSAQRVGEGDHPWAMREGARKATPGGSPRPAARRGADGHTERGDGAGRAMRVTPGGGAGRSSVWLRNDESGAKRPGPDSLNSRQAADRRSNLTGAPPLPDWAHNGVENMASGTSIFDPVLCEVVYSWFSGPGDAVLDPFAGGSVRGIVASLLGRRYHGVDLSAPQVEANREQAADICAGGPLAGDEAPMPEWHVGDARNLAAGWPASGKGKAPKKFDLVFSCPPYFDLEVYSDDPADLSQAPDLDAFTDGLGTVLTAASDRLADDRFCVLVMGEARAKASDDHLYGLIPATVAAAARAGLAYYNEAILVTMAGSLALRVTAAFTSSRKLGRTHQSVLVFVKGDPRRAAKHAGEVAVADLPEVEAPIE